MGCAIAIGVVAVKIGIKYASWRFTSAPSTASTLLTTEFTSAEGAFRAMFPVPPEETAETKNRLTVKLFTAKCDGKTYVVSFTDLNNLFTTKDKIPEQFYPILLDVVEDRVVHGKHVKTKWRQSVLHGRKYPGWEFVGSEDGVHLRLRTYMVGSRGYVVGVDAKDPAFPVSPEADAFLDSFQVTDEPPIPIPIHSMNGKFRATFPNEPKKSTQMAAAMTFTEYTSTSRGTTYTAGSTDLPPAEGPSGTPEARLAAARDATVEAAGATLNWSIPIKLVGKYPGWEIVATTNQVRLRSRLWVVRDRLYRVTITGSELAVNGRLAEDFLASFRLAN
jgi:hypothetical protein